jgi:hypothetical protein
MPENIQFSEFDEKALPFLRRKGFLDPEGDKEK